MTTAESAGPEQNLFRFYRGQSMKRTFRNGDYLYIQEFSLDRLHPGDIVVVHSQASEIAKNHYVHRVVGITEEDLLTCGDNNPGNDIEPVTEKNYIGRVTCYERNGKIHKVWNGRLGMMRARVLHGRLLVIRAAKFFLKKPYRMIKKTNIVAKFWRPEIETIFFETHDGPLIKYIHKDRTVASCWTDSNRWWFRRPYDFVIEPKMKKPASHKSVHEI